MISVDLVLLINVIVRKKSHKKGIKLHRWYIYNTQSIHRRGSTHEDHHGCTTFSSTDYLCVKQHRVPASMISCARHIYFRIAPLSREVENFQVCAKILPALCSGEKKYNHRWVCANNPVRAGKELITFYAFYQRRLLRDKLLNFQKLSFYSAALPIFRIKLPYVQYPDV